MAVGLMLAACSRANIVSSNEISAGAKSRPTVIYVADFDLDSGSFKPEGLVSRLRARISGEQSKAQSLVDLMGDSIVKDLAKKGLEAYRLPKEAALPQKGWLVRGAFLQVDEGNRLRRAIIGFGAGHTDLQVAVAVDDLSAGKTPQPIYEIQSGARSGEMPGAIVTLNPFVAAAKFALSRRDLSTDAKKSAEKIADEVGAHVNAAPRSDSPG